MSSKQLPAHRTHDVVVGVDGSPASANALRYAIGAAGSSGGKVDVIHVISDFLPMAGRYPIPARDLEAAGRSTLRESLRQLGHAKDGVAMETHLRRGSVVGTLTSVGAAAQTIVVGSDRRPVSMRLLAGNVSTGVAARSAVPVVSVPETWHGDRAAGLMAVGVKDVKHSEALMAEAFEVAQRTDSRLLVLHAWRFPATCDDLLVSDPCVVAEWTDRIEGELAALVAPWRHSHPEVGVELRAVHDHPAPALAAASAKADELVVVRGGPGVPATAHLGSTARTLLLYAHCPVRVVPAVHVPVLADLDLEANGVALKQAIA